MKFTHEFNACFSAFILHSTTLEYNIQGVIPVFIHLHMLQTLLLWKSNYRQNSPSHTKLETSPIEARENSQGIIGCSDLSHARHILSREPSKWILPFTRIPHVDEVRGNSLFDIDRVEPLRELARPSLNAKIVLRQRPPSAELPHYSSSQMLFIK
jgi:hypothetical protein